MHTIAHCGRQLAPAPKAESLPPMPNPRTRLCELAREFFDLGWMRGTGGNLCLRDGDRVYVAPSGRHKDRLRPDELFVVDLDGEVVEAPPSAKRASACTPLFLACIREHGAGCVLHGHPVSAALASMLTKGHFEVTQLEMMKGIRLRGAGRPVGYYDRLVIPVLENTAFEEELEGPLTASLREHDAPACLVRRHGVYAWGQDWSEAKRHAECLDWLFEIRVQMARLGFSDP